ncbi:nucleotidyltransferase domain-containing protein [Cyanobium sp. Aljojuca 7D2]|jgi:predicted nucleotidyltransferase|uniref:nucleotidyltransferase domain-containing protein n=1 Tax=Cyanobium sp. Aljojuca 7D2 TaxID=2823698 RepID=UPI0020CCF109|nr:nucleotidyltransferase domain-containing protein [Cyanobium sp. Aljojuca 7D2]MCP9890687.1 nucleotidyltransferase domain-containing protein [Cyanobium sp. Aljojuca 7D2]
MPTLAALREQRHRERLDGLRQHVQAVATAFPGGEVWLFGSLARGDWDAYSDVDLLAIAPTRAAANALADGLLDARLGDDVLALTHERWQLLRHSDDPYWRAIGRDALRLDRP